MPSGLFLAIGRALQRGVLPAHSSSAAAVLRLGRNAGFSSSSISAGSVRSLHTSVPFAVPPAVANATGPAAYVFDIDGVLVRGPTVLPAARKAMQMVRWGGHCFGAVRLGPVQDMFRVPAACVHAFKRDPPVALDRFSVPPFPKFHCLPLASPNRSPQTAHRSCGQAARGGRPCAS